ncbi:MAG: VOC family protein [Planctomycetes bacterium]|nr:VOC family protein [Planctomycetota bacterium]
MIRTINAVLLHSQNSGRLIAFYRDVVGLPLQVADHGDGLHADADIGPVHFAIFPDGDAGPLPHGPITISLQVDDVHAEFKRLRERGVAFRMPPSEMAFGGIVAEFRDPDGNGVMLMMWQSDAPAAVAPV